MNSGFVEAGSGKSISFADWLLVIHTDQNTVCILLQKVNRFICTRTLACKNQFSALLCGFRALLKLDAEQKK